MSFKHTSSYSDRVRTQQGSQHEHFEFLEPCHFESLKGKITAEHSGNYNHPKFARNLFRDLQTEANIQVIFVTNHYSTTTFHWIHSNEKGFWIELLLHNFLISSWSTEKKKKHHRDAHVAHTDKYEQTLKWSMRPFYYIFFAVILLTYIEHCKRFGFFKPLWPWMKDKVIPNGIYKHTKLKVQS